jgi:hypothetical protein
MGSLSLEKRIARLEIHQQQAALLELEGQLWALGLERGLPPGYFLQALRRYLSDPTDRRMDGFEATLTPAERAEVEAMKRRYRRVLGLSGR